MTSEFGDVRLPSKFWINVKRQRNRCWYWTGHVGKDGYATISVSLKPGKPRVSMRVHRYVYKSLIGPLAAKRGEPGHLQVDHECHNRSKSCPGGSTCLHRRCVNPAHLRAVTGRVNTLAGKTITARNAQATHCKRGHAFTEENTIVGPNRRGCKQCRIDRGWRPAHYQGGIANALKTHCKRGHEFTPENTYRDDAGGRTCKRCQIDQSRKNRRIKAALLPKKPPYQTLKTHCPAGHPLVEDNLVSRSDGYRSCLTCSKVRAAEFYRAKVGRPLLSHQRDRTLCIKGHPLSGDNLYIAPKTGKRSCRECRRAQARK